MKPKLYFIILDDIVIDKKLHEIITEINGVVDWWHFFNHLYIIEYKYSISTLHKKISDIVSSKNGAYIISEFDPNAPFAGAMSQDAWDWIKRR